MVWQIFGVASRMSRHSPFGLFLFAPAICAASLAHAEFELGVYGGVQTAPHSVVEGKDPGGLGDFDFTAGWEGRSFEVPYYYGLRGTWWRDGGRLGYGLEFNHAKVYADDETLEDEGLAILEFSDGINFLTANVFYRWNDNPAQRWTPYVGGGVGLSIPHVEFQSDGGDKTFEYQVTGPAVQWVAGISYDLTDRWRVFGEYKGTFSQNKADLDGGGELETNIITNALNVGVSFNF